MRLDAQPIRRFARRAGRLAPFAAVLLMIASPAVLARGDGGIDVKHQAEIAEAMREVPPVIGSWASTEIPVPTEAVQILRPNAILSRRFTRIMAPPSGEEATSTEQAGPRSAIVAIIHCGDVRDMLGHYPPRCYPANGWTNDEASSRVLLMTGEDGHSWPLRYYRFTRAERGGGLRAMIVLSAFILPNGTLATDASVLEERAVKKAMSRQGVAQLQFVFETDATPEACLHVAREILDAMPKSLLERLGVAGLDGDESSDSDLGAGHEGDH
ncbi:MAG: exosortase-associated EpsI family protein [Phycisphaerae bacterium]|nr:exosortase-associated EpsI family protein [Phycisphaerae bacterium]